MMRYRWTVLTMAAAATVLTVAGCNPDDEPSAVTSTPTVVTTTTVASDTATSAASGADQQSGGATRASGDGAQMTATSTLPPGHGTGASAYVGEWTRHASHLELGADQAGTLVMGSGAVNVEKWTITWSPQGRGIVITVGDQVSKTGDGVGDISKGETVTAELSSGANNGTTLLTKGLGDTGGPLTWCNSSSAGTPACGA
ncbi:hypothetical protein GOACH_26_00600 [Gordonia aichiensis NBRC 108223]|uniref:Lipoprotein n=2 Tax=Gordonia aichiensis TaxID=36820 RepID=L7KSB2_9ACTN|nr:hypothetical protein GOACH_26_00600 [Gordonia aichiensis NBRC 108223]